MEHEDPKPIKEERNIRYRINKFFSRIVAAIKQIVAGINGVGNLIASIIAILVVVSAITALITGIIPNLVCHIFNFNCPAVPPKPTPTPTPMLGTFYPTYPPTVTTGPGTPSPTPYLTFPPPGGNPTSTPTSAPTPTTIPTATMIPPTPTPTPPPIASLSQTSFLDNNTGTCVAASFPFTITNIGKGTLNWSATQFSSLHLSVQPSSGSLGAGQSQNPTISVAPGDVKPAIMFHIISNATNSNLEMTIHC